MLRYGAYVNAAPCRLPRPLNAAITCSWYASFCVSVFRVSRADSKGLIFGLSIYVVSILIAISISTTLTGWLLFFIFSTVLSGLFCILLTNVNYSGDCRSRQYRTMNIPMRNGKRKNSKETIGHMIPLYT